jgi:ABC-type glycerol-3-phosphate transport system substrate-binding protein
MTGGNQMPQKKIIRGISRRDFIKWAGITGGVAASASWLAACGPEETPTPEVEVLPDQVTFVAFPWGQFYDEILPKFESDYGVDVNWVSVPNVEELIAKVASMYTADEPADVCLVWLTAMGQWIRDGVILPLDDLPGIAEYKNAMEPFTLSAATYEGQTWGLPYFSSIYCNAYYMDKFEEAGLQDPPTSWDELVDQAQKAKMDAGIKYPIIWMAGAGVNHVSWVWYALVMNNGGVIFEQDLTPALGPGSVARDTLDWWGKTFTEWEVSDPSSIELRYIPSANAFAQGEHIFHGPTEYYFIEQMNREGESPIAGKVKNFNMPGDGTTLGVAQLYGIPATTQNKEWAWKLLQHVGGKAKDGEYFTRKLFAENAMTGPGYPEVMEDPDVQAAWSQWVDMDLLLEQWDKAKYIGEAVPAIMETWFLQWQDDATIHIHACLQGTETADEACDAMIAKANELKG